MKHFVSNTENLSGFSQPLSVDTAVLPLNTANSNLQWPDLREHALDSEKLFVPRISSPLPLTDQRQQRIDELSRVSTQMSIAQGGE
jgi:hypothetical protein